MAGDWIKMRGNLWDDPRVARLCDLTDSGEAAVIGGLYWLWSTADQHSEDGLMPGLTVRSIDRKTGVAGLGNALVSIGWIEDYAEGIRIIRFEEHNGASAKKRAVTAKRVSNHRGNADVTQEALQEDESGVTGALAREREEKEKNKTQGANSVCGEARDSATSIAPTRAAELSLAMRESGIDSSPSDPRLQTLADQGVSADIVRAAAQQARKAKPNERIATGYIVAIVNGWAADAAKLKASGAQAPPGGRPQKFDPVAFVNRNRPSQSDERTHDYIDVEAKQVA